MGYQDFKLDFVRRTLEIVEANVAPARKASLLINCLLGLLVLIQEKEKGSKPIPAKPLKVLGHDWGLKPNSILLGKFGKPNEDVTVRELVYVLRNAVAHVRIEMLGPWPYPTDDIHRKITAVYFLDQKSGKWAIIPVEDLKIFALKLGRLYKEHLEKIAEQKVITVEGLPPEAPKYSFAHITK